MVTGHFLGIDFATSSLDLPWITGKPETIRSVHVPWTEPTSPDTSPRHSTQRL